MWYVVSEQHLSEIHSICSDDFLCSKSRTYSLLNLDLSCNYDLEYPRIRVIMKIKTLTLRSDTRSISSQTAFPDSYTRVLGCRRG